MSPCDLEPGNPRGVERVSQNLYTINTAILHEVERLIELGEHCNPEGAEIPFDNILDHVTGSDPA
jgi:hypothetical protein